jgi:hypothetical protein
LNSRSDDTIAPVDNVRTPLTQRLETPALLLAVVIFFAVSCAIAQIRLLWYDEIFTRQVAQLGSWKRIAAALYNGIDLQPPAFYYLTHWTSYIGGEEIGLRLPAILGFTFAGFSLYVIARRWCSPGYAAVAAVMPSILFFGSLGMEARPYGLLLGSAALALLGWTFRHRWPLAGRIAYIAGVLGAAASHYYGFMIAIPFGTAAAWTLWRKRRWDFWTLGCVCAILPDLWNLRLIRRGLAIYSSGAWNPASWHALAHSLYGWSLGVLAILLLVYLMSRSGKMRAGIDSDLSESTGIGESVACWLGFSAIPLVAMFMAKTVSSMFVLRYFSMYSLGYGLLLACLIERVAKGSKRVGYVVGFGALIAFGNIAATQEQSFAAERDNLMLSCDYFTGILDQPAHRESRFLIGDPHLGLQLAVYCADLRSRVVFGSDPALQLRYLGSDTSDKAMLHLRENPPMDIEPLGEFLRGEQREVVVFDGPQSFLMAYLSDQPEYARRLHELPDRTISGLYSLDALSTANAVEGGRK